MAIALLWLAPEERGTRWLGRLFPTTRATSSAASERASPAVRPPEAAINLAEESSKRARPAPLLSEGRSEGQDRQRR